jgi:hypothetical protein
LEEEDGFKEAEKEDVDTESKKAVVPFFTGTIMAGNRLFFGRGYGRCKQRKSNCKLIWTWIWTVNIQE